jgi:hypothetical protein
MPSDRDDTTIAEFAMDDYPVVHVLWQRGDLWMRPSVRGPRRQPFGCCCVM